VECECLVQIPLIDLLCEFGAEGNGAMLPALAHGEFDAVRALLRHRGRLDLSVAAALGLLEECRGLLAAASGLGRHLALALAGYLAVVRLLVERGSRLDLKDTMFHATPEEWAAYAAKTEVAE
jgi:hypothetical protein